MRSIYLFSLSFFCAFPANAGIFDTLANMEDSKEKAENLKKDIFSGIVFADSSDGKKCLDIASATVVNWPGEKTTYSILSCVHTYNMTKKIDRNCRFYFKDSEGKKHRITNVITLTNSELDTQNDLAIYHLEEPVSCNPLNKIANESPNQITLSTLSYSWGIPLDNLSSSCNISGEFPFYMQRTFQKVSNRNIYKNAFRADQVIHLSSGNRGRYFYADSTTTPQLFLHGSGSSWFYGSQKEGYSLSAISSSVTTVSLMDIATLDIVKATTDLSWGLTPYTITQYDLPTDRKPDYYNSLTPLSPHKDWILKNCK